MLYRGSKPSRGRRGCIEAVNPSGGCIEAVNPSRGRRVLYRGSKPFKGEEGVV